MRPMQRDLEEHRPDAQASWYWNFMGHRRRASSPMKTRERRARENCSTSTCAYVTWMHSESRPTSCIRRCSSPSGYETPEAEMLGCAATTAGWPIASAREGAGCVDRSRPAAQHGGVARRGAFREEHGACGVLKKGRPRSQWWPAEEYFYPFYEEAQRLDLAICFHLGSGVRTSRPRRSSAARSCARDCRSCTPSTHRLQKVGERFPTLRFAAVECWLGLDAVGEVGPRTPLERLGVTMYDAKGNVFAKNRIYVTCQPDEDLEYIIRLFGDDNLVAGSDYSHVDPSTEADPCKFQGAAPSRHHLRDDGAQDPLRQPKETPTAL